MRMSLDDGTNGSGRFSTTKRGGVGVEAYEPLVTPEMVMNLPKGQAYAFLNAQRLVKLRFPLLDGLRWL